MWGGQSRPGYRAGMGWHSQRYGTSPQGHEFRLVSWTIQPITMSEEG